MLFAWFHPWVWHKYVYIHIEQACIRVWASNCILCCITKAKSKTSTMGTRTSPAVAGPMWWRPKLWIPLQVSSVVLTQQEFQHKLNARTRCCTWVGANGHVQFSAAQHNYLVSKNGCKKVCWELNSYQVSSVWKLRHSCAQVFIKGRETIIQSWMVREMLLASLQSRIGCCFLSP